MRHVTLFIIAVALLLAIAPAHAKKGSVGVDMEMYTCNDLMQERVEDIGLILMWVDGYISCETQDLYIDREWMQELAEMIGDACSNDPNAYLIDIVEDIAYE